MDPDWTREEVEATVAAYFEMLEAELRGEGFNKAEANRNLRKVLNRKEGAVEFKHQNISAVLQDELHPWIQGYKPRGNLQGLLREVVVARIAEYRGLADLVTVAAFDVDKAPEATDILSRWVDRPNPRSGITEPADPPDRHWPIRRVDYAAIEALNRSLGLAGEEFVLTYEAERLHRSGARKLSNKIEHVSKTRGDGLGYDIHSFEVDGRDRLIEVKTTSFHERTPIYVTRNELACSKEQSDLYHLYRVFDFRTNPRLFGVSGRLDHTFALDPVLYSGKVS